MLRKITSLILCFSLFLTQAGLAEVGQTLNLSNYLNSSPRTISPLGFQPPVLRYFSYDASADNFQLLLDPQDLKDKLSEDETKGLAKEQLDYFLVGLTLPNSKFWVNLRPDAPDNIIEPELEQTEVGRIMLESDLQLKKDTANFTSPQTKEGREYWDKLYVKARELFGTEPANIPTITRPWIVPGEILIREDQGAAYVYKATLKVMLEEDYLERTENRLQRTENREQRTEEHLPAGRQGEQRTEQANLSQLIDRSDLTGLTSKQPWSKETYFKEYQKSFSQGEYNLKEQVTTPTGQVIRSYVSGGGNFTFASSSISSFFKKIGVSNNQRGGSDVRMLVPVGLIFLGVTLGLPLYMIVADIRQERQKRNLPVVQTVVPSVVQSEDTKKLQEELKSNGVSYKLMKEIVEKLEGMHADEKLTIIYYNTGELSILIPVPASKQNIQITTDRKNYGFSFRDVYSPGAGRPKEREILGFTPSGIIPGKDYSPQQKKDLIEAFKFLVNYSGVNSGSSPLTLKASSMLKIDDGKIDEAIRFFRSHTYFSWSINIFLSENPHSTSTDPLDNIADSDPRKKALEKIGEYFVRYGNQEVVIEDAAEKIAEEAEKIKRFDVEKITPEQIKLLLAVYPEVIGKRYYGPDFRSNTSAPPQFFALPTLETSGIGDIIGYLGKKKKTKKDKERVLQNFAGIFADDIYHIKEAEDRAEGMIKRAEERLTTKASSSLTSAVGGIDLIEIDRYMQRGGGLEKVDLSLPLLSKKELESLDLEKEEQTLRNYLATGFNPNGDRLKRLLAGLFQKDQFTSRQLDLLRLSQELCNFLSARGIETTPDQRAFILITDTGLFLKQGAGKASIKPSLN